MTCAFTSQFYPFALIWRKCVLFFHNLFLGIFLILTGYSAMAAPSPRFVSGEHSVLRWCIRETFFALQDSRHSHAMIYKVKMKAVQSCPTLCDHMDYTVHGILQARIRAWVAFPFSRRSSQPRNRTRVSCIAGRFFTNWAIREALSLMLLLKTVKCPEHKESSPFLAP